MEARPGIDRCGCRRRGAASRPPAPPCRSCAGWRPGAPAVDSLRRGVAPTWGYARSDGLRAAGGIAPTLPSPASGGGELARERSLRFDREQARQLTPRSHPELAVGVAEVRLDRLLTEKEVGGNFFVGQAARHRQADL